MGTYTTGHHFIPFETCRGENCRRKIDDYGITIDRCLPLVGDDYTSGVRMTTIVGMLLTLRW